MESFTDSSGREIPLSQIEQVVGIHSRGQTTGLFRPDPKGPYHVKVKLADDFCGSKDYPDMKSAAHAKLELERALRHFQSTIGR